MADQEGAKRKRSPTPNLDKDEEPSNVVVASNIKKFLELGLLDGMVVSCFKKTPIIGKTPYVGKAGKIFGTKIYCLCEECNGIEERSTVRFEKHAGCRKKYPAKSFYFDNLNTVKDVMDMCKELPYESWGEAIRTLLEDVYDPTLCRLGHVCVICKGFIPHEATHVTKTVCNVCFSDDNTLAGQESVQDTQKVLAVKSTTASEAQSNNSGLNDQHGPPAYVAYMDEFSALYTL